MQYKLKKCYPGSPVLGQVVNKLDNGNYYTSLHYGEEIYYKQVENNPEFWERVEEKSYEILSYIHTITNSVYSKIKEEVFITSNGWSLPQPLENHANIIINSVKRLSDNEVFTLGDFIYRHDEIVTLEKIELDDSWSGGVVVNQNIKPKGGECLKTLKKAKEVSLTTEDGVRMYEGDKCWIVTDSTCYCHTVKSKDSYKGHFKVHRFSTKEAAEEYIIMNKPCLSIQDIKDIILSEGNNSYWVNELKKIVKSRL